MLIRTEAPADILTIDALLRSAFATEAEADLVMSLRENSRFTLSLIACTDEGEVIGHALFTPVTIAGEDIGWQGLGPIAVKQGYRQQGIASQLVREGFDSLLEFGYLACVVLGDPAFYSRFGFQPATKFNMHSQWDDVGDAFMVMEMQQGACDGKHGLVEYSSEFSAC